MSLMLVNPSLTGSRLMEILGTNKGRSNDIFLSMGEIDIIKRASLYKGKSKR